MDTEPSQTHAITLTDLLAHVVEEAAGGLRTTEYEEAHGSGIPFQNQVRGELGLAGIDSIDRELDKDRSGRDDPSSGTVTISYKDGSSGSFRYWKHWVGGLEWPSTP